MNCYAAIRLLGAIVFALSTTVTAAESAATTANEAGSDVLYSAANEHGQFRYLITFSEPGLLQRQSGRASGEGFDINAPGMRQAQQALQAEQAGHRQAMERAASRTLDVSHHYLVSHSGMATWLTPDEARSVAELDGVASVERERVYELDTYRGPEFIGAGAIWDGSGTPDATGRLGEDLAIAVLDTGVAPTHPSFANVAACGHGESGNPDKLISHLDCASTDGTGLCNGPSPTDSNGHGSHTASTAGGNVVGPGDAPPPSPPPPFDEISGVAPCAYIRAYKVCPGQCPGADVQAGMDSVLIQQSEGDIPIVTMNFSISGGTSPWVDNDRKKLDLVDAGIFVAASAGNTGPETPDPVGEVNHRGPWVMSVANITHDVLDSNPLSLDGGPSDQPALQGTGPNLASDYTGQLQWAGDVDAGNENGCAAFPANVFDGEAALIMRGDCNFSDKVDNAVAAGANFVVIVNNTGGPPITMGGLEPTAVSSVMILNSLGQDLIAVLDGGTAELTVLAASEAFQDPAFGDVLSAGSLRGPTPGTLQHLTKPDIAGPGTEILAAVPGGYDFISGTSMSSPHVAGAATLVRQTQPGWTVSEIKSAMQMTAVSEGLKDDGDAPWDWDDVGHGRTDLTKAALAGLVMDETTANYVAANPTSGGDVRTLNLPAVRDVECFGSCSWTRTLRNTLATGSNWDLSGNAIGGGNFDIDVSPATLSFADTTTTEDITITVTPNENLTDAVYFGEVVLTESGGNSPDLRITVAFSGSDSELAPEIGVDPSSLSATLPQNLTETQTLTISNSGNADLDWGVVDGGAEPWSDDFDSYENGSEMHGQGGWKGWLNDPAAGALVSDAQANSTPHSVEIVGASDLVREFTNVNAGQWTLTAQQFVPADFSGDSSFILLNSYDDAGANLNWSTEVHFDSTTDTVLNNGASGGSLPLVTDQWVELRVEIDLDANTQEFYYNDDLLYSGTWTEEQTGAGALNLGVIDLFANNASAVYYDDISLVGNVSVPAQCDALGDVPWLSAAPLAGTTLPGGDSDVDVTFDPAGIAVGSYDANLCIVSNDSANDPVEVPVSLEVTEAAELPEADITPASFEFEVPQDGSGSDVLNIGNTGEDDLVWSIEDGGAGRVLRPAAAVTVPWTSNAPASIDGLAWDEQANAGEVGAHPFANPRGEEITITHSDSLDVAGGNTVACSSDEGVTTSDNAFLRTFTLADFGVSGDFSVSEVAFGIENLSDTASITVNLYTLEGDFIYDNLTLIGSTTEELTAQQLELATVPVSGTAPADATLVVEIAPPNLDGVAAFFAGSNDLGETAPSYIASAGCGFPEPTAFADIGNPQVQLVMTVTGTEGAALDCELPDWLTVDPVSGVTAPAGSEPVDVMVDAAGLAEGDYEALLCVTTNDPNAELVEVPVMLTVTAGGPGELAVDPEALNFGAVMVDTTLTRVVNVTNAAELGGGDVLVSDFSVVGMAEFEETGNGSCEAGVTALAAGDSCTVEIAFTPSDLSNFAATLLVESDDGQDAQVALSGEGVAEEPDLFSDRFEVLPE